MEKMHIQIGNERQTHQGWAFEVSWAADDQPREIHLSWADYEYWCHGTLPPERVVENVFSALRELAPEVKIPARLDLSTVRRMIGGTTLDDYLRERM